jgi:hypothetical protein
MRIATNLAAVGLAATGLATGAFAQAAGNQNGMHFYNSTASVSFLDFPNFTAGNVAGDCLWKINAASGMKRGTGSTTATGTVFPAFAANFVTGTPLNIPDIQYRATTLAGSCVVPDFAAPAIATLGVGNITLPSAGPWVINISHNLSPITLPDGDTAICYLATAGETSLTPNACRGFVTTGGTSPASVGGCTNAKSGGFDAATTTLGTLPPNIELWLETGMLEPTVQPVKNGATSLDMGYGAYDFVVNPTGTDTLGWRVEALQNAGQFAIPLVSFTGRSNLLSLDGQLAYLDLDPLSDALIAFGAVGNVALVGTGPSQDGVYSTANFPIPVDATGSSIHVVYFFFDLGTATITGVTNTATTSFTF